MKTISDQILGTIKNSTLLQSQKYMAQGFIQRAQEEKQMYHDDLKLIEEVSHETRIRDIVLSTEEVKIFTVGPTTEFDKKNPYRAIYRSGGQWIRCNQVAPTLDRMLLIYLGDKHDGINSQFAGFASRMLGIGE